METGLNKIIRSFFSLNEFYLDAPCRAFDLNCFIYHIEGGYIKGKIVET